MSKMKIPTRRKSFSEESIKSLMEPKQKSFTGLTDQIIATLASLTT